MAARNTGESTASGSTLHTVTVDDVRGAVNGDRLLCRAGGARFVITDTRITMRRYPAHSGGRTGIGTGVVGPGQSKSAEHCEI